VQSRSVDGTGDAKDDITLLRRIARGDRAALGTLYDQHAGALLALAQRVLGRQRDLDDLVHDVFLEAWRHAGDYDPDRGSVKTWLFLRMRSRCLDRVRSHAHSRTDLVGEIEPPRGGEPDAERELDGARVWARLDTLPASQREVLELGYFRGLSFQEIADELNIPLGTVKSRVGAAILKLRSDYRVSSGGHPT